MSESRPAPHPDPPEDLASRKLPLVQLEILWFRIHKSQYSPLYYGYSRRARFITGLLVAIGLMLPARNTA